MIHTTRIADLTIDEFKAMMREVMMQAIIEVFADPDVGQELREDIQFNLQRSLAMIEAGGETTSAETVAARLGLEW
jgi:hypothetical protein